MKKKNIQNEKKQKSKAAFVIITILVLFFLSVLFAGVVSLFSSGMEDYGANTAVIPIKGVIVTDAARDVFGSSYVSSTDTVEMIKKADSNPNVKAIILEINSPGGSGTASDEISYAIKKTNKTTVALVREMGLSGGYWIASGCDYIIADRLSFTGSIGVIASSLNFEGFLNDHNVTYERLVAGKYKDIGTPFKEMTAFERMQFQKRLDEIHDIFIEEVAENRDLSESQKIKVSDALFYTAREAKELNLIDEIGNMDSVIFYLEDKINTTVSYVRYEKERTFLDALAGVFSEQSFFLGKGIGSEMFNKNNYYSSFDITT